MRKRIFIAINISEEARTQANNYLENLRKDFRPLRVGWERAEKLHLTLKFLGEIDEKQLMDLEKIVEQTARKIKKFNIGLAGTGIFPDLRKARVLWIGVTDKDKVLPEIFELLNTELTKLGFQRENKAFRPHLTIARLREPEKSRSLAERHLAEKFEPVEFEVAEIVIYESRLLPTGSKYSIVSKFELV